MKYVIGTLAVLALAALLGGAAIVGLGLYNVSARAGHLPGVGWVLHTTYRQSVRLRAPDASQIPADLDDPDRVVLGRLHAASACAFCHAAPDVPRSATARAMNPEPPHLPDAVAGWAPEELHWILWNGVKMSGMPQWPGAARQDEVWSMVAYLQSLKEPSPPVGGMPQAGCGACHGPEGNSRNAHIPRLDILSPAYIAAALAQYRAGTRDSGFMRHAASQLTDDQIEALSRQFGKGAGPQTPLPPAALDAPTARLARQGTQDVPACTACHGPGRAADRPIAPALAGQSEAYLAVQLRLWRDGTRGGGPRAELMRKAAASLEDDQIDALAAWFSALPAPD